MKLIKLIVCGATAFLPLMLCYTPLRAEVIDNCNRIELLTKSTELLSGLNVKQEVECQTLNGADYSLYAAKLSATLNDEADLRAQEISYKLIGLIPDDYRYFDCFSGEIGNLSHALYDRNTKKIILRSDTQIEDKILVHEILHALQDQHHNLEQLRSGIKDSDHDLAVSALIEGQAMVIEEAYLESASVDRKTKLEDSKIDCMPPEPLFSIFLFPYEWGVRFFKIIQKADSDNLERVFSDPPMTTSEVLYPEEYFARLNSETLSPKHFLKSSFPDYTKVYSDVLGEYVIRSLFRTRANRTLAILAGKGWTTDLLELFKNKKDQSYMLLWRIRFAKSHDVKEFLTALKLYSQNHFNLPVDLEATAWVAELPSGLMYEVDSGTDWVSIKYTQL